MEKYIGLGGGNRKVRRVYSLYVYYVCELYKVKHKRELRGFILEMKLFKKDK